MHEFISDVPREGLSFKGSLQAPLLASKEYCRSLDGVFLDVPDVGGLAHFVSGCRPLTCDEKLFTVPLDELPEEEKLCSRGMSHRQCVYDQLRDETRLRVAWGSPRPSLWDWADQCGASFNHKIRLYSELGLRGCEVYDPMHRMVRNREQAITMAGFSWVKTEWGIVFGFLHGPWGSNANFGLMKAALKEIGNNFDHRFSLFRILYPRFVHEFWLGERPAGAGSEEHMEIVFGMVVNHDIVCKLDAEFASSRWCQWGLKMQRHQRGCSVVLFVALYIALTRGLVTDLAGVPALQCLIGNTDAQSVRLPHESIDLNLKSLKEANKAMESLRAKVGGGSLLVVSSVLANPTSYKLGIGLMSVSRPLERKAMHSLTLMKTKKGCAQYYLDMTLRKHDDTLLQVWLVLSDTAFVKHVGFISEEEAFSEAVVKEEIALAEAFLHLARALVGKEIRSASFFTHRPPFAFLPCVQKGNPEAMEGVMTYVKQLQKVLDVFVPHSRYCTTSKNLLKIAIWPQSSFVLECLVGAEECDYKHFPACIDEDLELVSRGFGTTVACEYLHRELGQQARDSHNGNSSRVLKWHRCFFQMYWHRLIAQL